MKKFRNLTALALAVSFATATVTPQGVEPLATVQAASKISLNKKSATIKVGKSVQLKVKGTKKKVKWSSSNSKIAKVSAKGKVTGKKKGSVKITAKVNKKKLTCKVKVVSSAKKTPTPVATNVPVSPTFPNQTTTNTPTVPNKAPTNRPVFPNTPDETEAPVTSVEPKATSTARPTRVPANPTTPVATDAPVNTTPAAQAPTSTPEEGKQVSLALDFYLDPYDPTRPDEQFVYVNFLNYLNQDVIVETEAYVTTRGVDYPALIFGKKEGETQIISPISEYDTYGEKVWYDSWDYVQNDDCTMWWLPLDENSTLTFYFRVGEQRYKATINFDQKGALYREASDSEQLVPFTSAAPTTTPEETVTPSETEEPVITETPVATKEPTKAPITTPEVTKEPVALDLQFYLDPYDPTRPDEQFVRVNFENNLNQDVYVESEAYVTTRGADYPALITHTQKGETKKIDSMDYDRFSYDSLEYVEYTEGKRDDYNLWWLPLDENSTFTFFFRVGNQRYKANINFDQKGALFYEAEDSEQLVPFTSAAPTATPSETEKPVITETPVAPTATPEATKEPVALDLEFYLEPYDTVHPDQQILWVNFYNNLQESVFIESEAYVTTGGEKYSALISNNENKNLTEIMANGYESVAYDSWDWVKNGADCVMWWLPIDENSTLTFFFRVGNQRYKATINFDQKGGLYYKADDTEQLEGFAYQGNSDATTTE